MTLASKKYVVLGGAVLLGGWTLLCSASQSRTTPTVEERGHLAAVLRQLDTIERLIHTRAKPPSLPSSRYYFDYVRLLEDIDKIQDGIDVYLVPERAQPRIPPPLIGDYQRESGTSP